jgi:allophanate hydrolase subunit 2
MSHARTPLVFRIRNAALRQRFERFVAAESERVGYRLTGTEIAERAIHEFITKKRGRAKPTR